MAADPSSNGYTLVPAHTSTDCGQDMEAMQATGTHSHAGHAVEQLLVNTMSRLDVWPATGNFDRVALPPVLLHTMQHTHTQDGYADKLSGWCS